MAFDPFKQGVLSPVEEDAPTSSFDPFQEGLLAEEKPSDASFDPFAEGLLKTEEELQEEALVGRRLENQKKSNLEWGTEFLTGTVPGIAKGLLQAVPEVGKSLLKTGEHVLTGDFSRAGENAAASAVHAMASYPQLGEMAKRTVAERLGSGYTEEEIRKQVKEDIEHQHMLEMIAGAAPDPEIVPAQSMVLDPINLIPFGGGFKFAKGAGKGVELAQLGKPAVGTGTKLAATALEKIGQGTGAISSGLEKAETLVQKAATEALGDTPLAQTVASKATVPALLGSSVAGLPGGIVGALAPDTIQRLSQVSGSAARILKEGESSIPFFEALARDPAVTGYPKAIAAFLDQSGLGRVVEASGRSVKEGTKAAAMLSWFNILASGGDPEVAAESLGLSTAFGMAGAGATQPFRSNMRGVIALKQMNDVAAFLKSRGNEAEFIVNKIQTRSRGVEELIAVSQFSRANPHVQIKFVEKAGFGGRFDPEEGTITLNLDSGDWLNRIMAHELIHEHQASWKRAEVLRELIGNPETREDGYFIRYDENGNAVEVPDFAAFKQKYREDLFRSLEAEGVPAEKIQQKIQSLDQNPRIYAEEWLAESLGRASSPGECKPSGL